jgi:hypothetical protein
MHVIRHKAVRVQSTLLACAQLTQVGEINQVVGIVSEAGSSVMPALHDMQCDTWYYDARPPGHEGETVGRWRRLTSSGSVPE